MGRRCDSHRSPSWKVGKRDEVPLSSSNTLLIAEHSRSSARSKTSSRRWTSSVPESGGISDLRFVDIYAHNLSWR